MSSITITIDTSNSAFDGEQIPAEYELSRILNKLAHDVQSGTIDDSHAIRDLNGNTVGQFTIDGDK